MRNLLPRFAADRSGSPAVEFALVLPVFVAMLIGTMSTARLAGAVSGMNFAVAEAARCSAVNATLCGTPTATEAYAQTRYHATGVRPTFQASNSGCGHTVTANAVLKMHLAVTTLDVPVTATACFPGVDAEA